MIYKMDEIETDLLNNNIETAKDNVNKLRVKLAQEFNILYTNSRTLSVILNKYLDELITNDIKIKTNIKYNDFTFIADDDLAIFLDKLIVYAISKCQKTKDDYKFIHISSDIKNQNVIINFIFSSDNLKLDLNLAEFIDKYQALIYHEINDDHYEVIDVCFNLSIIKNNLAFENRIDK